MENSPRPKKSNSIHPYRLSVSKEGVYTFTTENGLHYFCTFKYLTLSLSPILGIYDLRIYEFDFVSDDTASTGKAMDERISFTIINLINAFFSVKLNVLIYLCDSADGRGEERHKLFKLWHDRHFTGNLIRVPAEIKGDGFIVYGCALVRKDFPHMDILKEHLFSCAIDLINEKYGS